MLQMGDGLTARIILRKGVSELNEQYPQDPSVALLHTQLWNLLNAEGEYAEALEQAQAAYDLMISYFGEDSADAAFHGIRLGISIIETNGDMDRAQVLLMRGGSTAASNLERFYTRLQEVEAAGQDPGDLVMQTKKLMLALAESNFYGALGVVRKALQEADELEVPMSALEEAWVGGFKQMGMALSPDHPMFDTAFRELARLVPDAAGRPALQAELEGAQTKLKELLYLMKQVAPEDDVAVTAGQPAEEGYLP